ncbi:MAG TPA: nucleotidyltransferase [Bryobacteraceae bacterium]|nr:nucleotidyltransferase [Bryobacteraceae bacterium]
MDAKPIIAAVARALNEQDLEAILIGNAAAALQGAPVTTVDLDFLIRRTPVNLRKLRAIAKALGAVVFTPHYPVSGLFRLIRDDDGLQLDFMTRIHGVRSFNGLRSRASEVEIEGEKITIAALADIIASMRSADRPRDRAVLNVLETTLRETEAARGPEGGKRA